jgi:cobalamin-dependent methionine synthase I
MFWNHQRHVSIRPIGPVLKIIGEKINGTRKEVAQAISARDSAAIEDLAVRQAEAGADWIDVHAGTVRDREPDDLLWLVETVQAAVDVPLCLDSANPDALRAVLPATHTTPLINSISGESDRVEGILPVAAGHGCPVIALALDDKRIAKSAEDRLSVIRTIISETRARGVPDSDVYVDPLVMALSTEPLSALVTFDIMRGVRDEFPDAHLTLGLSNVSFGLPARSLVNRYFLALAIQAGLDSAILDPLDREVRAAILTAELLLGRDDYCLNFIRASRQGMFDPGPTAME